MGRIKPWSVVLVFIVAFMAVVVWGNGVAAAAPAGGFSRPVVSLTFDDGWKSIHDNALPGLRQYGFVSTQYVNSQPIEEGWEGYMTFQDLKDFSDAGSEIAWHTRTHADLVQSDAAVRDQELTVPQSFVQSLMNINVPMSSDFATPFGSYDATVISAIRDHGFTSHRSTDEGFNMKADVDATHTKLTTDNIKVQNMLDTTTTEQVQAWLADAAANNAYLVLVYHEVSDNPVDPDPTYSVPTANFAAQLEAVKRSGITVETVQAALAELQPQL